MTTLFRNKTKQVCFCLEQVQSTHTIQDTYLLTFAAITFDVRTSLPLDRSLNVSPLLPFAIALVAMVLFLFSFLVWRRIE